MDDLLIRCTVTDGNYMVLEDKSAPPKSVETRDGYGGVRHTPKISRLSLEVVESKSRCKVYLTPAKAAALSEWLSEWIQANIPQLD